MIDVKEFIKLIDDKFWKHITCDRTYKDVINWEDINKDEFLLEIAVNINKHNHSFNSPEYIYFSKEKGILRRVKAYNIADTCIYYYCIKILQNQIVPVIKRVPNIFGGFRLSPDLKLTEEKLRLLAFDPLYETFARYNYRKEWSDYQNLAKAISDKTFDTYVHIDIAHFYDDINLNLLEREIRNLTDRGEIVDLLFYFLRNSDKKDLGYFSNNSGIPQEEVGEMSRLLANLYLHQFDEKINNILEKIISTSDFIFTRFADDMWIAFNGDITDAQRITQNISSELLRIKLHINEKKLNFFTKVDFDNHWQFTVWENLLVSKSDPKKLLKIIFQTYGSKKGRWFSPFLYALKIFLSNPTNCSYISKTNALPFLSIFINTPQLGYKIDSSARSFFIGYFKKFPFLNTSISDLINKGNYIHPNIEYLCLDLLKFSSILDTDKLNIFSNYYFKAVIKPYQWYSRVLCISYLTEKSTDLKPTFIKKISSHFENAGGNHNEMERRYNMMLLNKLSSIKIVRETIKKSFSSPKDRLFIEYIS